MSFPQSLEVTVILWVQLADWAVESVTVQVMNVTPTGYGSVRGFGGQGPGSQLSTSSLRTPVTVTPLDGLVVGVPTFTVASLEPDGAATTLSGGHVIVGGGVSGGRTVTTKVQELLDSEVEVIVFDPTGKNEPEAGELETEPQLPIGCAAE